MNIKVPTDLRKVLSSDPIAKAQWADLTLIGRMDFISWIESAKLPETRKKRVDSVPSRLSSGKKRPCCYAVVPMAFYKALDKNAKAKAQWKALTPVERRVLTYWIDEAKESEANKRRIEKACALLASGKRSP